MTYVIAQPCVDVMDLACVAECPVDCIVAGGRTLYIDPVACVDCHACEPVCPVEAIFYEADVPAEYAHWTAVNAEFFPGGGGPALTGGDHPVVAALPPQSAHKKEISLFGIGKEDPAIVDVWFPAP
ncbi:hypothetical protein SRB5_36940 [Streptomyces sp. RB5]|uniref:Ferredoxin n=1 Tax=Streptomyces smaragdinus TaxID=2585196 RepID=A0A7K0CJC2_9ACTN|nr:hypothetical protein [Streptomyces smaragdinus]